MTAYLIVRAEVDPAVTDAFDTWYENEHLPDALKSFNALAAKRGWSSLDASMHIAIYEFPDLAAVNAVMNGDAIKGSIKEFDRHWHGKVTRSREIVEFSQEL
jgi:hypothetical protein